MTPVEYFILVDFDRKMIALSVYTTQGKMRELRTQIAGFDEPPRTFAEAWNMAAVK